MEKLLPLARWYCIGSALVVTGTAFLTWIRADMAGQDNLLMLFLAAMLMLVFLSCIPLAIMNILSKDYWFTAAVAVLAYFMVGAHFKVIDTLGVNNIQMQVCIIFLVVCLLYVIVLYKCNIKCKLQILNNKIINIILRYVYLIFHTIKSRYSTEKNIYYFIYIPMAIMTIFIIFLLFWHPTYTQNNKTIFL